jgi:hypothetical protein
MKSLISTLLLLPLLASCATPMQLQLDAEVRRLCAVDGGIKVYEPVRLAPEKFDKWGDVVFYDPTKKEAALGAEYTFRQSVHYYQKGNPDSGTGDATVARRQYQIIRNSDGKLLGEAVLYGRRGGDVSGPWHPSTFICPRTDDAGDVALIRKIFLLGI